MAAADAELTLVLEDNVGVRLRVVDQTEVEVHRGVEQQSEGHISVADCVAFQTARRGVRVVKILAIDDLRAYVRL